MQSSTLKSVDPAMAEGTAKELFNAIHKKLGVIPNMTRLMANSPAALSGYLSFSAALSEGMLPARLQEQIAIAVAEGNGCEYCLSAHNVLGKMSGLEDSELEAAQEGRGEDARTTAALKFATKMVANRGHLGPSDVENLRASGFEDSEIAEIVAVVALNIFTNYFNNIAKPNIDFPPVKTRRAIGQ